MVPTCQPCLGIPSPLTQQLRLMCKTQSQQIICSDLKNLSRECCIEIGSLPDLLEMVRSSNIISPVSLITCLTTVKGGGDDRKENATSCSTSEPDRPGFKTQLHPFIKGKTWDEISVILSVKWGIVIQCLPFKIVGELNNMI